MMRNKGGHGIQARITIDDIPQAKLDLLNSSTVTYEIRDAKTGVLESTVTRPMRSFTANFLRLLWGRMTGTACTGGLDINDTAIDESSGKATNLKCVGPTTGLKKFGICIGTGTGAVAQTDNKLTWDTGFTTYGATTLKTATTISGSKIYFEIQKQFVNSTGSSRTIYEAGLCTTGEGTEADNNTNVLIAREITNGVTGTSVANGKTLTVVFKISSTFTTDGTINKTFLENIETAFRGAGIESWKQATASAAWSGRYSPVILYYDNALWIVGGYDTAVRDSVYKSIDFGLTWTEVRASGAESGFVPRARHCAVVFAGKMWVFGGRDASGTKLNSTYYSTDGATWTATSATAPFTARETFAACVFTDPADSVSKIWLFGGVTAGGNEDSVYKTTDGATWTLVRSSGAGSGFIPRSKHSIEVLGAYLYVFFGITTARVDSVYKSLDGNSWSLVRATGDASGPGGRESQTVNLLGSVFVCVGGSNGYDSKKDVWTSTDGQSWTQATSDFGFADRYAHSSVVAKGILFVCGGARVGYANLNDCIYSDTASIFNTKTAAEMNDYARIDPASDDTYGITAGTGTGDFVGTDTVLGTPIADGTGAGQLVYGDMTDAGRLSEPTVSGSDNVMRLERDFTNSSGGAITIKEVGLSAKGLDALGLLLMRGKVDKAVANGASVRVAIELETTV